MSANSYYIYSNKSLGSSAGWFAAAMRRARMGPCLLQCTAGQLIGTQLYL